MRRLLEIQNKLKAPKGQRNAFGKYNYRSCEDIMEAVKPLLYEQDLILIVSDEIVSVDGAYSVETFDKETNTNKKVECQNKTYIKATASLYDSHNNDLLISVSAFAREEISKKGMDASQVTGATSSYARKYALNGLFAIDDTKDADATNTHGQSIPENKKPAATPPKKEHKEETEADTIPITPDFDVFEELKNKTDMPNLVKFYNENKSKVKDIKGFDNLFKELRNKMRGN